MSQFSSPSPANRSPDEENASLRNLLEQARAAYGQQQQQQQQLQAEQMQAMAGQMQALMQQAAAGQQAPPAHREREPTMGKLDTSAAARYSGKLGALDAWLMVMQQRITFYGVQRPQWVAYAAAHLEGAALQLWTTAPAEDKADWDTMRELLTRNYQPINAAELTRGKLRAMTQRGRPIALYVAEAQALFTHVPEMHVLDRIYAFTHGLDAKVREHVEQVEPTTLADATVRAVRFGARTAAASSSRGDMGLSVLAALTGDDAPPSEEDDDSAERQQGKPAATRAEVQQLMAMLRSSTSSRPAGHDRRERSSSGYVLPVLKHLTPTQVRDYMEKNLCFQCGKTGHSSRFCPNKKKGTN